MRLPKIEIKFKTIGRIYTEYKEKANVPSQFIFSKTKGKIKEEHKSDDRFG